jgi:RNA polymerase-interacting CarD/CdnL/TRCF family regulator
MEYTEGIAFDGTAILKNGEPMTISEILKELNQKAKGKKKMYRKKDLISLYNFIKEECDIVNTSGYAQTHVNRFIEKRLLKNKLSNLT